MKEKKSFQFFTLSIEENNTAWIEFDLPGEKVNKITTAVIAELSHIISELSTIYSLKAIFFTSGKPGIFIAGADIRELEAITGPTMGEQKCYTGHKVLNMMEQMEIPTVALIDGACLGGGMELALACTYRVGTDNPKTKLGQPEVQLGIIPGFGGTQRLPRLIGLEKSLDLILSGRTLDAKRAKRMGVLDEIVPASIAKQAALAYIEKRLEKHANKKEKRRFRPRTLREWILESNPFGRALIFRLAKKSVLARTHGNYPAPLKALEAVKTTQFVGLEKGLAREAKLFSSLVGTPQCKNLIRVFFLQEELKKKTMGDPAAFPVTKGAVIGAGVMGAGIAYVLAKAGLSVRLKDIDWGALAKGRGVIGKSIYQALARKRLDPKTAREIEQRISLSTDNSGFRSTNIVIEAAPEILDLKKKILGDVAAHTSDSVIVATNTSSLSVDAMAKSLPHPGNVIGMHFFNPVEKMPLVEVIVGEKTAADVTGAVLALTKQIGKIPVIVRDSPGFFVNRVLMPYMNEAALLLEEGVPIAEIDNVMLTFGMPMGPLELFDEVGIDIAVHAGETLYEAFGDRMRPAKVVPALLAEKRLGKKNGLGFYLHTGKNKKPDERGIEVILRRLRQKGEINLAKRPHGTEALDRMTLIMVNEAVRCVEEGVVESTGDADAAMILGTGFAPFRGGPLRFADEMGLSKVVEKLEALAKHRGMRFAPAGLLVKHARENKRFTF